MIKTVIDFIKSHRHAIIWTLCYFACMWIILRAMFGFNMLSSHDWWRLTHAHIRGFAGFVFLILILAMLPMYTATTLVIARTGEPLFKISLPAKFTNLFKSKSDDAPTDTPDEKPTETTDGEPQTYPANLPNELKPAFRRTRQYGKAASALAKKMTTPSSVAPATPIAPATPVGPAAPVADAPAGLALPDDFDFEPAPTQSATDMPMFRDIDFDVSTDTVDNLIPAPEIPVDAPADTAEMEKHLDTAGRKFNRDDDIIVVDDMAIAAHCDNDFWIADDETWFATGKSKPSPIAALTAAAARGLKPVLHLGSQNIMDIDTLRITWEKSGIRIITSPDEL